jgi:hypothetical protein
MGDIMAFFGSGNVLATFKSWAIFPQTSSHPAWNKHPSLFALATVKEKKLFIILTPGP